MLRMIAMRIKASPSVSSEWRCFFCLHVRTATIIFGIWHLFLHVLILAALAIVARYTRLHDEALFAAEFMDATINRDESNAIEDLPTPLSKIDHNIPHNSYSHDHSLYYNELDMAGLVAMFTLTFNLMFIYGAIKKKPGPLLPFFCLQLFDFAVSTLTATGYACYMRSMHRLIADTWEIPFRSYLLQLSPQCLSLVVLLAFIVSMLIKAYCIGVVWRCYKYLTLRQQTLRSAIHYIMPGDVVAGERGTPRMEPDYSSLLPDYEAACKQTPPPSYQVAVAQLTNAGNTTSGEQTPTPVNVVSPVTTPPPEVATTSGFARQVTTVPISLPASTPTDHTTDAVPPVEEQVATTSK